jgi:uncharacterized protein (DUF1697 family)
MSGVTAFVALVRGINVGGKTLKMATLTSICESLGLEDVKTYLQSGNVMFRSRSGSASLAKKIEDAIRKDVKMEVRVMVRTHDELQRAIDANPFTEECKADPSHTIIVFLDREPSKDAIAALRDAYKGPEPMHFHGRELYIFYGGGMGKSKLTPALYEKKLGVSGTARNWNTVTKLAELLSGRV